jgi:hypothetical protein
METRADFGVDQWHAVFGAEYHVQDDLVKGLGHGGRDCW